MVDIGYQHSITARKSPAGCSRSIRPSSKIPSPRCGWTALGTATVHLRVCFCLNFCEHSWLKVRSSLIRLVKRAFQLHGISMPGEAHK